MGDHVADEVLSDFSGEIEESCLLVCHFYLGSELILIYPRKFYRPSVPSVFTRYAVYSAQFRSECISQQV
jgi:hypothetical protein